VAEKHGDLMACKLGCDDCCSVYFELSLIEAFVISGMFRENLQENARRRALERAAQAEPLFREADRILQSKAQGKREVSMELLEEASKIKIPCPLKEDGGCLLYTHRPITCRLYGTPQKIANSVISCPKTGFQKGGHYMTVDVDALQKRLFEYSQEFMKDLIGRAPHEPPGPRFSMPVTLRTLFDKHFFLSLRDSLP
jgi:Fe-S-cluster containining protein